MATYVVNQGLAVTTNRIAGAGTEPRYVGWGVGAGTTAKADTALFGERLVDLATAAGSDHTAGSSSRVQTTVPNDTYQVVATRVATGAGTVTNAGLFDAASGGNLFLKGDFTGIGLNPGESIAFTINAVYS